MIVAIDFDVLIESRFGSRQDSLLETARLGQAADQMRGARILFDHLAL